MIRHPGGVREDHDLHPKRPFMIFHARTLFSVHSIYSLLTGGLGYAPTSGYFRATLRVAIAQLSPCSSCTWARTVSPSVSRL